MSSFDPRGFDHFNLLGMPVLNGHDYSTDPLSIKPRPKPEPMPEGDPRTWPVRKRGLLFMLATEDDRDLRERVERLERAQRGGDVSFYVVDSGPFKTVSKPVTPTTDTWRLKQEYQGTPPPNMPDDGLDVRPPRRG